MKCNNNTVPKDMKDTNQQLTKSNSFVLSFGAMIGWGWVVLSGEWITAAGTLGAVLAFLVGGVLVLLVGQVYAELTAALSGSQGVLEFTCRGVGRRFSFVATWILALGYFSIIAFEAVALPSVIAYLFPNYLKFKLYTVSGFDVYLTWLLVGVGCSIIVSLINYIGIKIASRVQTFLVSVVGLVGAMLMIGAISGGDVANLKPFFSNGLSGFFSVLTMTPFMYVGFDVITSASSEITIPQRKIGTTLLRALVTAVGWYVAIIISVSLGLPRSGIENSSIATADAMENLYRGNTIASKVLICGGIAGIIAAWNAFYLGSSRVIMYMSEAGMLPAFLGKKHPKYNTPSNAIVLLAVLTSIAPLLGGNMMKWLVNVGSLAMTVTYLMVSVAYLALRKKEPSLYRPYNVKYWKQVGAGSIMLCLALAAMYLPGMPSGLVWPYEWIIVLIWVALGAVFYFSTGKK